MKMHALKMTAAEKKAKESDMAGGEYKEPEGIEIHINHDHLQKLGMKNLPKHGDEIEIHGKGHVIDSGSGEDVHGNPANHARVRVTHMGLMNHTDAEDAGGSAGDLKQELFKNAKNSDEKQAKKDEEKASRKGKKASDGKEIEE